MKIAIVVIFILSALMFVSGSALIVINVVQAVVGWV
jgi:hypothetical protein